MSKVYHTAQQWDDWLTNFLGQQLLLAEKGVLLAQLAHYFGKHALLMGVPQQSDLLKTNAMSYQTLLTPLLPKTTTTLKIVEGSLKELPIMSGTIDLVLLPHTLEQVDNPRQLLSEACRIVKPEGHVVILGFNPLSGWGLKKMFSSQSECPWSHHFTKARTVKKWLSLADFELVKQETFLFRPPVSHRKLYQKLFFLETIGRYLLHPWGGAYMLVAKAKVIPFTPVRLRWQQKLSNSIGVTLPGSSI